MTLWARRRALVLREDGSTKSTMNVQENRRQRIFLKETKGLFCFPPFLFMLSSLEARSVTSPGGGALLSQEKL